MNTERREEIKDILRKRGEVKLKDLEEHFPNCSSMTLRRDLKFLEDNGYIKRTRGGRRCNEQAFSCGGRYLFSKSA